MSGTKKWSFVIGSMDCYDSVEDLIAAYEKLKANEPVMGDIMIFEYDVPVGVSDDIALMMGKALAFDKNWTRADPLSFCPEEE
jgi:hypothetical protein